jgi:alkanesulfonate monooxygenase SsuD/methylene tetrahydromethanopterin reductase-like flavin-dependent oxidoreductase (luciferase family)/FAD/FMN-containing dehydrogenase
MPDYGLPLQFGTFVTPGNADPELPVALAQLSEQLGYDLVTFQDHPYQPAFLDTWTLMSWVAARTQTIHIAPNVLNIPMRQPAVVARSAASLDLLSGGRLDLALGAGGFWDAIEAMGEPRRTPGQAVDALSQAIDVIHGIWDVGERSPLHAGGEYHHVDGAKRGPAPAHDIPLWIGAAKPRMQRLIGRKADGWLPSLPWLKPVDMLAGNAIIDEAAEAAGRDPREIRRLLNVGGDTEVGRIVELALEHGFATFIVMGDDPTVMQRFAEEIIPEVREQVDRQRSSIGTPTGVVRAAAALAKRRDGIDYEGIPESLRARAVEPGDSGYARVRSTYLRGGAPGLVLRPTDAAQVAEALAFARGQTVALSMRSGGHGISGRSTNDGGIVIDVGALNEITVLDESSRLVRLGPGARWMEVAAELGKHGWALSSGDYGGVGVGGLATAGGIGWLVREHGLTIDHLRAVEVVLADGTITRATATENSDLFWAMRGAGANFGIATAFEFEVDQVGDVGWAQLAFDATDTAGLLERWGAAVEAAPRDLTSFIILGPARRGQPPIAQTMTVVDSDDADTIIERLTPIAAIGPMIQQEVQIKPYSAIMANADSGPHAGQGQPSFRSGLLDHITPEFAEATARLLASGEVFFYQIRSVGGAVSDVATDATAYAGRSANFSVAAVGSHPDRLNDVWKELEGHFSGLYLSFDTDQRPERLTDAFPSPTLARLRELKRRYDPDQVFRDNFPITPEG